VIRILILIVGYNPCMVDYFGLGFAWIFLGMSIFAAIVIFLMDIEVKIIAHLIGKQENLVLMGFLVFLLIVGFIGLGYSAYFAEQQGWSYITKGNQVEQQSQTIIANFTCINGNCSANVPNNLQISCPTLSCPQQNQTLCSPSTQIPSPEVKACPSYPMLSIPKI
jgi:hypothetical protein